MKERWERGVSLLEILVILALVGVLSAIAAAAMGSFVQEFRLNSVARELSANIQLARLKAISSNFPVTFTLSISPKFYQISGTEDVNGDGIAQPWEDMNGNGSVDGMLDKDADGVLESVDLYPFNKDISYGTFSAADCPDNTIPFTAISSTGFDVTTLPASGTITFKFSSTGAVTETPDDIHCIVVKNQNQQFQAVCVDPNFVVHLYKIHPATNQWTEIQ